MLNNNQKRMLLFTVLVLAGMLWVLALTEMNDYTSTNDFCNSCHVHPQATQSWKLGNHFDTRSGVVTNCVDCHLPPGGLNYIQAKVTTGLRDIYGVVFKDDSEFNWQLKSTRDAAVNHVYKLSCLNCHQNLFPRTLSTKGEDAHLYYEQNKEKLRCINCHLESGHFHEKSAIEDEQYKMSESPQENYTHPVFPDSFTHFTEHIPGTRVDFNMIAIPDGEFKMGSPGNESRRREDEGPQKQVKIKKFWMAEIAISWDVYEAFYKETGVKRDNNIYATAADRDDLTDAVSGPTPPYGNPDQGWGRGKRPAISMTHYAAQKFCEWLSQKTGKHYRLPTEAEWEYACRSGSSGPYFFAGNPDDFDQDNWSNILFGLDTTINKYVVYAANSGGKTQLPESRTANAFGLINMAGNVKEFCSDIYGPYSEAAEKNSGTDIEYVVRGGSFKCPVGDVRSAARETTQTKAWLFTDPQIPKSRWWYSDCNDVGFRIVCDYPINP